MEYQPKKKPGHLVNLGELVGPETYNLLFVALVNYGLTVVDHIF